MSESTSLLRAALNDVLDGEDLAQQRADDVLRALTDDSVSPALCGGLLSALRMKGETADEIRGFATAMRALARRPDIADTVGAIDIVGTGGDGSGSFNISTGSALLTAACGVPVIKHGNRSVSSKSGSADVLETLGLPMPLDEAAAARALAQTGFTFLFAPYYHPAMKTVAPVRQAMGVRTVFNILGPLTNPAAPPYLLIGAFSLPMAKLMADALAGMPIERAFVIHGEPGWDEATPVGVYDLFDVRDGRVAHERRDPQDEKFARCAPDDLAGGDAEFNARCLRDVISGHEQGAHYDALVLGASLALEVTGVTSSRRAAIAQVKEAINAGRGRELVDGLARQSSGL
ncbi:MAG: anthranilate phosphoribosyltransferase [Gammaproteobacteria bacterium]